MPLFRVSGIQISLHFTFFLFIGYFGWEGWRAAGLHGLVWTVAYLVMLFVCITLHEFGHGLTARRYRVQVPRILLTPIGGIIELGSLPRQPRRELAIIAAGPAVNFVLAAFLALWVPWPRLFIADGTIPDTVQSFVQELLRFNIVMGLFNLIPVFPMDGGRMLRAGLATRMPYLRATAIAARVGQLFAAFLVVVVLTVPSRPNYLVAALFTFIYFAAENEYRWIRRQESASPAQAPALGSISTKSSQFDSR